MTYTTRIATEQEIQQRRHAEHIRTLQQRLAKLVSESRTNARKVDAALKAGDYDEAAFRLNVLTDRMSKINTGRAELEQLTAGSPAE
jgi:ribosomal protein S20